MSLLGNPMRIYTPEQCAKRCDELVALDERRLPLRDLGKPYRFRCDFPSKISQLLWFARCIESALQPRTSCLVWVTEWGVFPSGQNLHLFYRFRETYGDRRLLHEAPGHLCLEYESAEVVTLVHLGILFGWDVHLIPTAGYARAFVSHHAWVDFGFDNDAGGRETARQLETGGLTVYEPVREE